MNQPESQPTRKFRIGKIEAAILAELRAAGGDSNCIDNHGPGTGAAIDRMEAKGWLINQGSRWQVSETAP